ncbi:MAG TPA: hypothetical protein VMH35_25295 [Streptosporangiaceae bacterium]|nr:hypothetical protein [Streptosporangiaceae bacterium]
MTGGRLARKLCAGSAVLLGMAGPAGIAGLAAPAAAAPAAAAPAGAPVPVLVALGATQHARYDKLVFTFASALPRHYSARYVSRLPGGPELSAARRSRLLITFSRATGRPAPGAHGASTTYGPAARSYPLPSIMQVATVANHRKTISFEVGLAQPEPFHLLVLPHHRIALEVTTPGRTVQVRDYFVQPRGVFGAATTQPVARPVTQPDAAANALRRLFAGPTGPELARGLRFVASGATSFALGIRHGVARVQLKGGCSSGGSPVTVATEIIPTLRQFRVVHWVKIYSPAGATTRPRGDSNSIPACLAPATGKVLAASAGGPVLAALVAVTAAGVLLGLVISVLSVLTGLARGSNTITPQAYQAERIKAHPVAAGQFGPDRAWPGYPLRQARADLARIEAGRRARYRRLWRWPAKPIVWVLLLPVTLAAVVGLLAAGLTTVLLVGLFAGVTVLIAGGSAAVYAAVALLLRGSEQVWHRALHAEASCPHCYHLMPRPAYRCPGCSILHRDLRPGRLGLFVRRCACGRLLPTMVLRAGRRLTGVCQKCAKPLRAGAGTVRDVRIPIFGDTSAGKTRFLYAGLDSLADITRRAQIPFGFPDDESQDQAAIALDVIRSGRDTVKTSFALPTALTCRVGKGVSSTLIHLFDAAGEVYQGAQMQDSLGFLDHGNGLVYVLDPFSIGAVRDHLAGQQATAFRLAHAAAGDPETAYGEVVTRLRDNGVQAAGQRLAIVVSKADLLESGGLDLPEDSAAIAGWLNQRNVHNLVLSADRDFAEVRYFAVASLAAPAASRRYDPAAPLRWLLASRGLRLPGDPEAAGPGQHAARERGQSERAQL